MALLSTLKNYFGTFMQSLEGRWPDSTLHHKWTILAGVVAIYGAYSYITRPKNLPPGPRGLPFIGALLQLSNNFHIDAIRYSRKYKSDIVSFYIGKQLNVVLNSADAIKLAFAKTNDFADRDPSMKEAFDSHDEIFTSSYSEYWRKLKTFCMSSLKTYGFGTVKSEQNIKGQLERILRHIESHPDQTMDSTEIKTMFAKAGGCVIMKIVANQDYEFDDPELVDLVLRSEKWMDVLFEHAHVLFFYANMLPSFLSWIVKRKYVKDATTAMIDLRQLFLDQLKDHKATLDISNSRDFMDDLLIHNESHNLTELQMADTILMYTPDAMETSSDQMSWILFFMCCYQDAQEKMVQEIKSVCGDDLPALKDRNKLIYCEAVTLECFRLSSLAVFAFVHYNSKDTELNGYVIPKETIIQANLYAAHYDERVFPEPEKFKPTRYLSPEGKLTNYENVMPFSTGRRKCVGEPLTKSLIFVYLTGLVQKFQLSFPHGQEPPSWETDELFRFPPEHKIKFMPRY